ncbi:pyridoxamine 5'-phosphate oxidase family protein [Crocinitomicaceae bacterium]|nr:pyridoxamine 5'-phosphate oxidase family protein [Crocinitomicaceae bacterium]MDB3907143.1 pyridoxamine 5'-phosphate oxidase family protein [Crocinitomicaceae bacterium]
MEDITSIDALRALYDQPKGRALKKVLPALEEHSRHFIASSPFVLISTYNSDGKMDVSPRGGGPGFVEILNNSTLLIPDYKGNNRLDSLTNIIETGRIGTVFLIPGIDETLGINGSAKLSASPSLLAHFTQEFKVPTSCIVVEIEEVFLHCAKALMRSQLWNANAKINSEDFPTMGKMLNDQIGNSGVPESRTEMIERYKKDL